jgi:hypothetical protein
MGVEDVCDLELIPSPGHGAGLAGLLAVGTWRCLGSYNRMYKSATKGNLEKADEETTYAEGCH